MKNIPFALLTVFAVLILPNGAEAQSVVIDDFTSGNTTSQVGAGTSSSSTSAGDILGGQRLNSVEVPNLSGDEFFGAVGFNNGNLVVSQGSLDEIIGGIQYSSLGGIDLTGGGAFQNFLLDFTALDSPIPISDVVSLSVTSGGTTFSQDVTIPDQNSTGQVQVDFSSFNNVNLTSVDSIELEFDFTDQPGRDFQLGSFSVAAVPEPGSLTILSMALSAMLLRRRRK